MTDKAMVEAVLEVAKAINSLAFQVKYLGNGDAATPMGAIEAFSAHLGEKMDALTGAIDEIGSAVIWPAGADPYVRTMGINNGD